YELSELVHTATIRTLDYTPDKPITPAELLAGGVGSSNYGPDDRRIDGTVEVVEKAPDGTPTRLRFDLTVTVFDVIDFAPVNPGSETAQGLTKALRALEAAGRAFDRPVEVTFSVSETR